MSVASKKSKTQQLKERWEDGELDCGAMTPEFIKGLSPRELGMLGELITIDYFNERGYTLLEQGYRCTEGEADLVLLDELDDVVVMAEVKTRRVALDCNTRVFPEEAVDAQKQRRYRRIASCYLMEHYPLKAIRFDAVGVTIRGGHIAEIEHQYNAFDWQVSWWRLRRLPFTLPASAAPIVDASTLDMDVLFSQSRYEEQGSGDYLNAPLNKEEYETFIEALTTADRVVLKDFEGGDLFQACQPAEEVARTGKDAIRFGAMKPVGLTDPRTGRRPWAAIQLRAENKEKTAYNLVGFQTNLTFGEQKRVFHMVPGLENAEFFRYGVMHRNTFVDAPHVLDGTFAVPGTGVRLAGQITGTEGYMEAVATGLLAALNTYAEAIGAAGVELPRVGALGALVGYATDPATVGYQPMHVNFGLVPPLEDGKRRSKRERYQAYADRALEALDAYLATRPDLFGGDRS